MTRILFLLAAAVCLKGQAQCYPNIGFDSGNFSGWIGYRSAPQWNNDSACFIPGYHTITGDLNAIDSCCYSPVVAPGGGFFSARLGDTVSHIRKNKLVYSFTVNPSDTVLYIKYAVVLGGSPLVGNYTFFIHVLDSAVADTNFNAQINYTGNVIWSYIRNIAGNVYCAGQPNPCPFSTAIFCNHNGCVTGYIPWTTAKINLSAYIGRSITCYFMTSDGPTSNACEFTYAYIDMYCDSTVLGAGHEQNITGSITVYPNPTSGVFTIKTEQSAIKNIEVINVLGEKVYRLHDAHILNHFSTIDLSSQPAGIYFVRVKTEKGIVSKKIVISR